MHIDSNIPYLSEKLTIKQQVVFYLEESNIENGCTVVVPGSHLSNKFTDRDFEDTIPITANPGDVVIWDSRLWHGTLDNKLNKSRWALVATLSQWWCKQSLDIVRSVTNEIYQSCTDEEKQLLGFCAIPSQNEFLRNNTKCGYDFLKESVSDYFE